MLILAAVCTAFAVLLLTVAARAQGRLNAHVEMPVAETEAVVLWGPWASHGARCSCNVCR